MERKFLKRGFFKRLFGICATKLPSSINCWSLSEDKIEVDLNLTPELSKPGGGIRIESKSLSERILVIHGDDGEYHAFRNKCGHAGRRLDPVLDDATVQCCSVGRSTYNYEGKLVFGNAKKPVQTYPVEVKDGKLIITFK